MRTFYEQAGRKGWAAAPPRWLSVAALLTVLSACNNPTTPPPTNPGEPGTTPPPPPTGRTLTTWTVAPAFSSADLSDRQTRAWYEQIGLEVAQEVATECVPNSELPLDNGGGWFPSSASTAACTAIKHFVGRSLNYYVTTLLTVFRTTGDPALLEEVDRVMEIARARLADTDGDGFRNFGYLPRYGDNDFNPKEDSLAHGFLAEVAYVFRKNAAYSTPEHDYAAHADAWTAYLREDFEGKRSGRRR